MSLSNMQKASRHGYVPQMQPTTALKTHAQVPGDMSERHNGPQAMLGASVNWVVHAHAVGSHVLVAHAAAISPTVGDVRHEACCRQRNGAGHDAAVRAHNVADLAAHLLPIIVPHL